MANKITRLFGKNRQFPKINPNDDSDLRDTVRQINERLEIVENAVKEVVKDNKDKNKDKKPKK